VRESEERYLEHSNERETSVARIGVEDRRRVSCQRHGQRQDHHLVAMPCHSLSRLASYVSVCMSVCLARYTSTITTTEERGESGRKGEMRDARASRERENGAMAPVLPVSAVLRAASNRMLAAESFDRAR